jgi:hypothetical protein
MDNNYKHFIQLYDHRTFSLRSVHKGEIFLHLLQVVASSLF